MDIGKMLNEADAVLVITKRVASPSLRPSVDETRNVVRDMKRRKRLARLLDNGGGVRHSGDAGIVVTVKRNLRHIRELIREENMPEAYERVDLLLDMIENAESDS